MENLDTGMKNPGTGMKNSGTGMEEPGTDMENPGTGMENPGTGIKNPDTGMEEPGTGMEINLTETEKHIIGVILENPMISITDIAKKIDKSRSGTQYVIDRLKKKNVLKREGTRKKGSWVITEAVMN